MYVTVEVAVDANSHFSVESFDMAEFSVMIDGGLGLRVSLVY